MHIERKTEGEAAMVLLFSAFSAAPLISPS